MPSWYVVCSLLIAIAAMALVQTTVDAEKIAITIRRSKIVRMCNCSLANEYHRVACC
jgi:hypothetical protein